MALQGLGWELYVQVMDLDGDDSGRSYILSNPLATSADAEAALTALSAAWPAVSDSVIRHAVVRRRFYEDTVTVGAGNNTVKATVVVRLDPLESGKEANIQIPAPDQGIFVSATGPNAKVIDAADAGLLAFVALFQTTGGVFSLSDGETVADTNPIVGGRRP